MSPFGTYLMQFLKTYGHITNAYDFKSNKIKISDGQLKIPKYNEYSLLMLNNYTIIQLRVFTKRYNVNLTGNKPFLLFYLYIYLRLSNSAVKIQQMFRGKLYKNLYAKYVKTHGPGVNRKHCTNTSDFYSLEDLTTMSNNQFFSFKDKDGFIYGCDILSLNHLIKISPTNVYNPYNRMIINPSVILNLKDKIRLSELLNIPITIEITNDLSKDANKQIEQRALGLFQTINEYGNYADFKWFMNLTRIKLIKMLRELIDIWTYRAQLSNIQKINIFPPHGNPFVNLPDFENLNALFNLNELRNIWLNIIDAMLNAPTSNDNKTLGIYYILGSLTIVSDAAALSIPWLYESFQHNTINSFI